MNVYSVGAYGCGNFGDDCYATVLRAKLSAVWPDYETQFHRLDSIAFCPEDTHALVLGGGGLLGHPVGGCGTDNLEYVLRYPAAMHWFGKSSFGIGLGVQGALDPESLSRFLPVIDSMALRTTRDPDSARMLRAAGVTSTVHTCADLAYLLPVPPRAATPEVASGKKPVLGVVASQPDKNVVHRECEGFEGRILDALRDLENDFDIHFLSFSNRVDGWLPRSWHGSARSNIYDPDQPQAVERFIHDFSQIDLCLTTRFHGLVLSVLREVPLVAIGVPGEKLERECAAFEYPLFVPYQGTTLDYASAVRQAWMERSTIELLLSNAKQERVRLAERNIELLRTAQSVRHTPGTRPACDQKTLVIWAAGDDFWDEASPRIDELGRFDCLLPASSELNPVCAARRIVMPEDAMMHCAMMPAEITRQLERNYNSVVLAHALQCGAPNGLHLADFAFRFGHRVWEYRVWSNRFVELQPLEVL